MRIKDAVWNVLSGCSVRDSWFVISFSTLLIYFHKIRNYTPCIVDCELNAYVGFLSTMHLLYAALLLSHSSVQWKELSSDVFSISTCLFTFAQFKINLVVFLPFSFFCPGFCKKCEKQMKENRRNFRFPFHFHLRFQWDMTFLYECDKHFFLFLQHAFLSFFIVNTCDKLLQFLKFSQLYRWSEAKFLLVHMNGIVKW